MVVFSSCTFRSCWESTSPDSVPPAISFRYCWSILSMAAFRSFLKPCGQKKQPAHPPRRKLQRATANKNEKKTKKQNPKHTQLLSKLVVVPCLLLEWESQSFWVSGRRHSQTLQRVGWVPLVLWDDGLPGKTHTQLYLKKQTNKRNAYLSSPTSCRDRVIGSFSSVSSSSNTGLDDVDGSFSSFWSGFKKRSSKNKHRTIV